MANQNEAFDNFVAKLPRTGHEIGRDFKFTSSVGMILPVWQHVLNPSERINFTATMQTISNELVRPAFLDIRQKIDLFFVPFTKLYTGFGQHFYQTNDFITSGVNYSPEEQNPNNILPLHYFNGLVSSSPSSAYNFGTVARTIEGTPAGYTPYDLSFFDSKYKGQFRLLMHLGYNPCMLFRNMYLHDFPDTPASNTESNNQYCTPQPCVPWMAAAYQCIYQDYYRDDDREKRNLLSYQLDYMLGGGFNTGVTDLQYHQRKRDYFTNIHVSPILSTLNQMSSDSLDLLSKVDNFLNDYPSSYPSYGSGPYASNPGERNGSVGVLSKPSNNQEFTQFSNTLSFSGSLNTVGISTGLIRSLFAVEKLNRITGRARKNYDSQVLAHFGFKVPRDIKHDITFIGSIEGNIGVSTVVSNSAAAADESKGFGGTELGERAGLAYGSLKPRVLDFTAPCHGIVMAVYYAIPNQSYPLIGKTDKLNILNTRLDFYQPEFDRLGMQPMFGYEVVNGTAPGNLVQDNTFKSNLMIGWQNRYAQFKQKADVHSLAFYRPYFNYNEVFVQDVEEPNSWSPWVLGRNPFDILTYDDNALLSRTYQEPTFTSFMVSPTDLNGVFVQKYITGLPLAYSVDDDDETRQNFNATLFYKPWIIFQTDPFMHDLKVDCKLVSPMSVTGEPELD